MNSASGKWGKVWRYEGKRGVSWRIRYTDAAGTRVLETLGREPAWNRKRAEAELRRRLVDVEREGYRKPEKLTFAAFAERWLEEYLPGRQLKLTTEEGYRQTLRKHLLPYLGSHELQTPRAAARTGRPLRQLQNSPGLRAEDGRQPLALPAGDAEAGGAVAVDLQ